MKPKDVFGRYGCVPRELHPAWYDLSYYSRLIALDLFSRCDNFADLHVSIHGPWMDSLCKQLAIPGPERRNAKRAMQALVDGGFIHPEEGRVRLVVVPSPAPSPAPSLSPLGLVPSSVPLPVVVSNSTQDVENTQLTSPSKQASIASKRADAPAREVSSVQPRPDLIGFRWFVALWGRSEMDVPPLHSFERAHTWIGSRPSDERDRVAEAIRGDAWCQANKHLVSPDHITKHWPRYLGGAAKTVVRADPREADAAARVKAMRDDYNARIRQARAAGDEYSADIIAAERDQRCASLAARLAS